MEQLIINLIILFIIVASLARGLRDVLEKGRAMKAGEGEPKAPGRSPTQPSAALPAERQRPASSGPVPGEAPTLEDFWRSFTGEGPRRPEPKTAASRVETVRDLEAAAREIEADTVGAADRFVRDQLYASIEHDDEFRLLTMPVARPKPAEPARRAVLTLGLRFGGDELVRGIVMSEILGPPAALRQDR